MRVMLGDVAENHWAKEKLEEAGVPVRVYPGVGMSHHKLAIFDGTTTILGSTDWTTQSFYLNKELSLEIEDTGLASWFDSGFESDWAESGPDFESDPHELSYKYLPHTLSLHAPAAVQRWGMKLAGAAARLHEAVVRPPDSEIALAG